MKKKIALLPGFQAQPLAACGGSVRELRTQLVTHLMKSLCKLFQLEETGAEAVYGKYLNQ